MEIMFRSNAQIEHTLMFTHKNTCTITHILPSEYLATEFRSIEDFLLKDDALLFPEAPLKELVDEGFGGKRCVEIVVDSVMASLLMLLLLFLLILPLLTMLLFFVKAFSGVNVSSSLS